MKFESISREEIFKYAKEKFGTNPEYLWAKSPNYAVLRNSENSKWYAIVMNIPQKRLGLKSEENIDILDVKCDPILIGSLLNNKGYFPGYHMNKKTWLTLLFQSRIQQQQRNSARKLVTMNIIL